MNVETGDIARISLRSFAVVVTDAQDSELESTYLGRLVLAGIQSALTLTMMEDSLMIS